ncbi:MAG: biosynthetic-type acetolactate synthase large subunit [Proteobacteria bacterium]|nr:biosynthetic-type acetolactate synthase large subunit [Pseudomonadota bacterium]
MKSVLKKRNEYNQTNRNGLANLFRSSNANYTGADLFFKTLLDCGVDTIFGYPGGKVLSLYDRMLEYQGINHILVNHEQGATHAAEGYARVTGKPGVVLTTSGPGATNTVTGIADAFMDSIPIVVFTGQVEIPLIGKNAFQESNIVEITRPITKWNCQVRSIDLLESTIKKALQVAVEGKPGPVLVDIPKDIFIDECPVVPGLNDEGKSVIGTPFETKQTYLKAAELIKKAKRPVLYVGGGVISGGASSELRAFALNNNIPVTTTLMGLGAFPETHELSLGMLGMHGTWYANMAVQECDVLIAVGARFDDRVTSDVDGFSPHSKKIHIDIDSESINRNVIVDVPINDYVKQALQQLSELVKMESKPSWLKTIQQWKSNHPLKYQFDDTVIKPQLVIEKISELTDSDATVVTDVGQHQMWAAQYYSFKRPRQFVTSGGLGTMGFGLPAAIGASLADPDSTVVCICGDGGFRMTSAELATAVSYQLPIKIIVFNNGSLGMVRQWQSFYFKDRFSHTMLHDSNPDFQKLAECYGAMALRASKTEELDFVLAKALSINDRPVLVECLIDPGENVLPMVSPGAALHNMIE